LFVDPALIDVNIHPTKTEIKFQHDKDVYAILRAAVKRALGRYSVAPSLDFEQEPAFDLPLSKLSETPVQPRVQINPNYNPFQTDKPASTDNRSFARPASFQRLSSASPTDVRVWLESHQEQPVQQELTVKDIRDNPIVDLLNVFEDLDDFRFVQVGAGMAVAAHQRGMVVFDVLGARERILYERFLLSFTRQQANTQQQLFPPQINLSPTDFALIRELSDELRKMGFDIAEFGQQTIVVQGTPSGMEPGSEQSTLQQLLEQYRNNREKLQLPVHENLARSLARSMMIKAPVNYSSRELRQTAIDLLHCDQPFAGVNGKPILKSLRSDQVQQLLQFAI
jgi:DNA mismatch repair protein MutL